MFVVLDRIAIGQKLTALAEYLDELEQISQYSYQEFIGTDYIVVGEVK